MSVQNNAQEAILESVDLADLDLPFQSSPMMDFHETAKCVVGTTLLVGYLSDDTDCANPLEDCDGVGRIYSAHRHSSNHAEMQEALALDSDWEPDLDLVEDHLDRLRKPWIDAASQSEEFQGWATETAGPRARLDEAYFKRRAAKLWRETGGEYLYGEDCIDDFDFTTDVRIELWNELRSEGLIGDRDAVVLDCYDHGGQVWSITGQGMQCQWDTATGAGVWVPDDDAREEIERRASVYAFGLVLDNGDWTRGSGRKRYYAVLDNLYGGESSPQFSEWSEAFDWLSAKSRKLKLPKRKLPRESALLRGRERAAAEIAKCDLDTYNNWLQGFTFGVVVATYENVGTADEPEWSFVESDECWGYIGDDYAMEEVRARVTAEVQRLQPKAA